MIPARISYRPVTAAAELVPHLREVGLVVGAYFAYMYTRRLVFPDIEATALDNARRIVSLEKSLGFFWEPHWQSWALDSARGVVLFFNWAYFITFFPIVLTTGIVLYFANRQRYTYYRNVVLISFGFALLMFMLFPLAPPRMLADHFVDTIKIFGPPFYASREAANYYNAFAAMPSVHFSWTVILGIMFFRSGSRWLKILGVVYPTMTLFAITITGNHYILDAVGGVVVMAASFAMVELGLRRRFFLPQAWCRLRAVGSQHRPLFPRTGDKIKAWTKGALSANRLLSRSSSHPAALSLDRRRKPLG